MTPRPPTAPELAALLRWQRRMVASFTLALLLLLVGAALQLVVGPSPPAEHAIGIAFICLAAYGGILQLSARCPICRLRLGLRTRLLLPPSCPRCGTSFRPQAPADMTSRREPERG